MTMFPEDKTDVDVFPIPDDAIGMFQLFADFLRARESLLEALKPEGPDCVRAALNAACVTFYELARSVLPGTPEEILAPLTKTVVLNACRAAGSLAAGSDGAPSGEGSAKIVDLLRLGLLDKEDE
jgi:hypothetical protein